MMSLKSEDLPVADGSHVVTQDNQVFFLCVVAHTISI